ncbi:MAG: hypothetical protein AB7O68_26170 [Pirellulales bacterium]
MSRGLAPCAALAAMGIFFLAAAAPVRAVSIYFGNIFPISTNELTGTLALDGSLTASGGIASIPIPHQTWPVNIAGDPAVSTQPQSSDTSGTVDLFGTSFTSLSSINVDLLNGPPVGFAMQTVELFGPINLEIDLSGSLTALTFEQTATSSISTFGGSGGFQLPGSITATISDLTVSTTLIQETLPDQTFSLPVTLAGTWKVTWLGNASRIDLDGNLVSLELPLSYLAALTNTVGVSATFDMSLLSTLKLDFDYYLSAYIPIAEPSSVVLLVVGLLITMPLIVRPRRKP